MVRRDIVVIGASAGGIQTLGRLVEQLPEDLPAALCVVQHVSAESPGVLSSMLDRRTGLRGVTAKDGQPIETGVIYVAAPDHHLLINNGKLALGRGPRENRARPAIDPLFRSVADSCGPQAIGIILSGMLNDGTSGLQAIKKRGGTALVQDPSDALYPEMPRSALDYVEVDYCRPVSRMGNLIGRLVAEPLDDEGIGMSEQTAREVEMNESVNGQTAPDDWGEPASFTCPDCGGPLREHSEDGLRQYRCKIGHRYTAETLLTDQNEAVEQALQVAWRTLEERASMLRRMADQMQERNRSRSAASFEQRAEESRKQADLLREVLDAT